MLIICQRVSIFSRDNANQGNFRFDEAGSSISGRSVESGDSEGILDTTVEGPQYDGWVNIRYITDILKVIDEARVEIRVNAVDEPIMMCGEGREDMAFLIMPMQR